MNAAAVPLHMEREESGILGSFALALLVHLLLFGALFIGVRWQSRPPETVTVELWSPPAPVAQPRPEPRAEPAAPKPEPKVEVPKPDIAIKEKAKSEPKPKPKPVPEVAKPLPVPAKPRDEELQRKMQEELAREQQALKVDRERREIKDQLTLEQAAARQKALSGYADKIKAKVKGNWRLPMDLKGNPEAVFVVIQLPTGEVLSVKLKKSSGNVAYDMEVERAILKSSPLPKPEKGELFERELILTFRPRD